MQKLVAKFNERGARQSNLCVCKFIFAKYRWFYMHKTCNENFFWCVCTQIWLDILSICMLTCVALFFGEETCTLNVLVKFICVLRKLGYQISAFVACQTKFWQLNKTVVNKNCAMDSYNNGKYLCGPAMALHNSKCVHAQCRISSVPQNAETARVSSGIGSKNFKIKTFLNKKW